MDSVVSRHLSESNKKILRTLPPWLRPQLPGPRWPWRFDVLVPIELSFPLPPLSPFPPFPLSPLSLPSPVCRGGEGGMGGRERGRGRRRGRAMGRGREREGPTPTLTQLFVDQQLKSHSTRSWSCQLTTTTFNSELS